MEKRAYRRLISQEHAKTRGITFMAFNNTLLLRKYGRWAIYGYAVAWLALATWVFTH